MGSREVSGSDLVECMHFLRGEKGMFRSCGSGCHCFKCYLEKLGKKKYLKIKYICERQNKLRVPKKAACKVQGTQ